MGLEQQLEDVRLHEGASGEDLLKIGGASPLCVSLAASPALSQHRSVFPPTPCISALEDLGSERPTNEAYTTLIS
jgi:hypothetical protein